MATTSLFELFCQEIRHGMFINADTQPPLESIDAKAGAIKTAIDEDRMEDSSKKWFEAAAEASVVTGVPIICHTESAEQGMYLAEFYLKRGVVPGNIIICHLDRTLVDVNLHREIASLGVYVEYDTIGRFKYHDDVGEARLIAQMIEWGFERSILMGLDTTRERLKSYGGNIGLGYIVQKFIPLMRSLGIPDKPIRRMVVENPAEAFSVKLGAERVEVF
jgi:phosphotriesterase-related protein